MRMTRISLPIFVACALGACGDNSKVCGPGTTDVDGTCTPTNTCGPGTKVDPSTSQCVPDGSVVCTDGTMLDTATGTCVVDPNSCQDGTVLIAGACVDPTRGLVVDLDEGVVEPNGLNVIEASSVAAGTIVLKPIGGTFVIHGKIAPFQDVDGDGQLDPDVDSYLMSVSTPTRLEISVDGVNGIDGGFVAIAPVESTSPLVSWSRFAINLSGDTSKRQLFLPAAGTYVLAIADTRTLYRFSTGGPQDAAPGPGDYYVSITTMATPTPALLVGANNVITHQDTTTGDVQLFTVQAGSGLADVTLAMPTIEASPSLVILDGNQLRQVAFALGNNGLYTPGGTTETIVGGFTDTPVIAVDEVYDYAQQPASYTLTVRTSSAQPLGSTATETETTNGSADPLALQQFYFDVTSADQLVGLALAWNHAVVGSLYDGDLRQIARFTQLGGSATWTSYAGLVRFQRPGRYYFLVYDPTGTPGTTQLVATTTLAQLVPTPIDEGVATGTQTIDADFHANAFAYTVGTDPWQLFDATGSATGGQHVRWFDTSRAYGRLNDLATSNGTSAGNTGGGPLVTLFEHTYATGGGAIGRVVLDDPSAYLVLVDAPANAGTFDLSFAPRAITDLGTLGTGTASSTGHTLAAGDTGYFLFRTTIGDTATVTTHPQDAVLLDTQFQRVNADESALGPVIDNPTGDDTEMFTQAGTGWTAVIVTAVLPPATPQLYDFTVTIAAP